MSKKQKAWETDIYYQHASFASKDMSHPAMVDLKKLVIGSARVLDLGCGEGTRLYNIAGNSARAYGVDISQKAIKLAKKTYDSINFLNADLEKLPFSKNYFDLVYSAYVFEHLENPEKVLLEAKRVLKKEAKLLIVCPNYGSPNRTSPVNQQTNRLKKMLLGFFADIRSIVTKQKSLNWQEVNPLEGEYFQDSDTTIEPYLRSLEDYLKNNLNMQIIKKSSCWSQELKNASMFQKIFRFLAILKIYPFTYWGPHMYIIAEK